ncbi:MULTISPECIES: SpoIIE family protein phosphatase [unclassified Streptomyces]|uniref:SpoIIE family protein phosphatase n=1 Tax=unclassified Streptomyces TaxID=2593676 RepID=UPI00352D9BD9
MTGSPAVPTAQIRIDHYSAVDLAAAAARTLARTCRMSGALPEQAAVLASELASNLDKHASDGTLYLQPLLLGGGLEILAADCGPGMADLRQALTDGYTTTATLGAGLGAVSRIATDFTIRTQVDTGTLACARLSAPGGADVRQDIGSLCLPVETEKDCGDACAAADTADARTVVVVDGLGHGSPAAEAAQTALRVFQRAPDRPLPDTLTAMHRALRHTRGAAVGMLRLRSGHAEYCGIGNVRASVLSQDTVHHRLSGQPGVVGLTLPTPRTHRIALEPGAVLVLHSDGIDERWTHAPSRFLLRLPPALLAVALAHNHRRIRDDAGVVVARAPGHPHA